LYFHPLNFIRFVLAVGVLLFHYGLSYFPFNLPVFKTLILHSSFRVSFFFFISGFVMSLVYGKENEAVPPIYFYRKRLSRIFPVYLLAFVLTLVVVLLIKGAAPKGFVILLHALGLQSWYPGFVLDLNFTTWSISVELFFYALFPFLLAWMMKLPIWQLLLAGGVVWLLQSVQHFLFVDYLSDGSKKMEEFISSFPLWHLGTFFSGMVAARLISLNYMQVPFKKNATLLLFVGVALFIYVIYVPNPVLKYVHNGLLAPLFALLVLALYFDRSVIHRVLSRKSVSRLGDLSYGIFIFQYPLWVLCTHVVSKQAQITSWFFLGYFISVLLTSYLINRFFEKPVLGYLRRDRSVK
jgi:peptidoglycan/LPS O-acetylase OafA/YrhL